MGLQKCDLLHGKTSYVGTSYLEHTVCVCVCVRVRVCTLVA